MEEGWMEGRRRDQGGDLAIPLELGHRDRTGGRYPSISQPASITTPLGVNCPLRGHCAPGWVRRRFRPHPRLTEDTGTLYVGLSYTVLINLDIGFLTAVMEETEQPLDFQALPKIEVRGHPPYRAVPSQSPACPVPRSYQYRTVI